MAGLKKDNLKGKRFNKDKIQLWSGVADDLLSYEEMNDMNDSATKPKFGFFNKEIDEDGNIKYTLYIPKKTRNKKDIVAAHKRSSKKTNRQQSKLEINNSIND